MRKKSIESWVNTNWQLCREIVKIRDRGKCAICSSKERLQVDHCFTRATRALFYDISNLTLLCGSCHFAKSKTKKCHADLKVYRHVMDREGLDKFNEMSAIDDALKPFPEWQYVVYHEQQNIRLKEILAELNSGGKL